MFTTHSIEQEDIKLEVKHYIFAIFSSIITVTCLIFSLNKFTVTSHSTMDHALVDPAADSGKAAVIPLIWWL